MLRILTVVGARPQFVKAAMVSRALKKHRRVRERVLHTGQHYDHEMSAIFFRELGLSKPYRNLSVGSASHGEQTARMLEGIEAECLAEKPDLVLIYGDTNSTVAAALAATKLHIPVAHVEAGLRSFNRRMPEEINRIVADRLSSLLFAPTATAVQHLKKEGITTDVHRVGDVMVDAIHFFRDRARRLPAARIRRVVPRERYFVLTLHRAENTDDPKRLRQILRGLASSPLPILFPVHPRTKHTLQRLGFVLPQTVRAVPPLSYLEMTLLQDRSVAVWTDSGGMQKEAVVLGKRCFTLRDETEWVETVKEGWNTLLGADSERIARALLAASEPSRRRAFPVARHYGDGRAAERIACVLAELPKLC